MNGGECFASFQLDDDSAVYHQDIDTCFADLNAFVEDRHANLAADTESPRKSSSRQRAHSYAAFEQPGPEFPMHFDARPDDSLRQLIELGIAEARSGS